MMQMKEIVNEEKPRERLLKYGVSSLSNTELLAIVLKTGTKDINVCELSNVLLSKINGFNNLKNITVSNLTKIKGIGIVKAIELISILEIGKRLYSSNNYVKGKKYNNSKIIFDDNKYLFIDKKQEYFYCIYLNTKKELIERKLLFMGTVNRSLVHPREIFKEAYLLSASGIICIHNHPSGDETPSMDDIMLTDSLREIGKINQIEVVDHIIFGNEKYYSFYENGKLK